MVDKRNYPLNLEISFNRPKIQTEAPARTFVQASGAVA
jgi:hypothetical protein